MGTTTSTLRYFLGQKEGWIKLTLIGMKILSLVAVGLMVVGLAGCTPKATDTEAPNDLKVEPAQLVLTVQDSVSNSSLRLVCGCEFPLTIDKVSGDTNGFRYEVSPTGEQTNFTIKITALPSTLTPGLHNYSLEVSTPDYAKNQIFRKTLTATINIP